MANYIKPERTKDAEFIETEDGITTTIEHYRQGDHYYRIIWSENAEPIVEDETL